MAFLPRPVGTDSKEPEKHIAECAEHILLFGAGRFLAGSDAWVRCGSGSFGRPLSQPPMKTWGVEFPLVVYRVIFCSDFMW